MNDETTGDRIAREFFEETKPRFTQPVVNCQLSDPIDAAIAEVERERDEARGALEAIRKRVLDTATAGMVDLHGWRTCATDIAEVVREQMKQWEGR